MWAKRTDPSCILILVIFNLYIKIKIKSCIFFLTDHRWYITQTNETEGVIRSALSGAIIYPELQWEYNNDGVFTKANFTMTLQYGNAALWTGLELYGHLLAGILIVGLVLNTFLTAIGK